MSKIGTLIIKIQGDLFKRQSIDILQNSMHLPLSSISDKYDFDYKRFGFLSAIITWVIPLKIFWQNDFIYKTLKSILDKEFSAWQMDITLTIEEKGE